MAVARQLTLSLSTILACSIGRDRAASPPRVEHSQMVVGYGPAGSDTAPLGSSPEAPVPAPRHKLRTSRSRLRRVFCNPSRCPTAGGYTKSGPFRASDGLLKARLRQQLRLCVPVFGGRSVSPLLSIAKRIGDVTRQRPSHAGSIYRLNRNH